jgi:hypothetical protein
MAEKKSWDKKFDAASGNFLLELGSVFKEAGINSIFLKIKLFLLGPDLGIGYVFGMTWKVGSGSGINLSGPTKTGCFSISISKPRLLFIVFKFNLFIKLYGLFKNKEKGLYDILIYIKK